VIAARDSSFDRPDAAAVEQARAAGVRVWGGYAATLNGVGLAATWSVTDFERVRQLGGLPIAFCSGRDDPARLAWLAKVWRVQLYVDVENGIRSDGPWVQGFLDASGAGLYGLASVHWEHGAGQRRAAGHIVAHYAGSGDPRDTWDGSPRPAGLCGYQWQGTHSEFGLSVDSLWLDDGFLTGGIMAIDPQQIEHIRESGDAIWDFLMYGSHGGGPPSLLAQINQKLDQLKTQGPAFDLHALATEIVTELTPHLSPGADPLAVADAVLGALKNRL